MFASASAAAFWARGTQVHSVPNGARPWALIASGCRSGCLIRHRPAICSMTSLESIRTSIEAPGAYSAASSSPAINPEYSATLLVVMPSVLPCCAMISPVTGSRTRAPYAAGPGFPREPPSASTMTWVMLIRVLGSPEAGTRHESLAPSYRALRRPDQDPAALLTAQHEVRRGGLDVVQVRRRELHPAAHAALADQRRGADAAVVFAQLLVLRDERLRQLGGDCGALVAELCALLVELLERGVAGGLQLGLPAGERLGPAAQVGLHGLGGLELLHHLELGVLQVGDPPLQRADLVLQVLQVLRRGDLPGVDPLLVADPALPDLLDIGVGLLLLTLQVADLGVGGDQLAVDDRLLGGQLLERLVLGQRAALARPDPAAGPDPAGPATGVGRRARRSGSAPQLVQLTGTADFRAAGSTRPCGAWKCECPRYCLAPPIPRSGGARHQAARATHWPSARHPPAPGRRTRAPRSRDGAAGPR